MNARIDRLLSEFIDAWNAGERPRVDDYLQRASPGERDELASRLEDWLLIAPTPSYSRDALAAIRAEPAFAGALAEIEASPGAWPELLPRLRERASLRLGDLANRVTAAFGLGFSRRSLPSDARTPSSETARDTARWSGPRVARISRRRVPNRVPNRAKPSPSHRNRHHGLEPNRAPQNPFRCLQSRVHRFDPVGASAESRANPRFRLPERFDDSRTCPQRVPRTPMRAPPRPSLHDTSRPSSAHAFSPWGRSTRPNHVHRDHRGAGRTDIASVFAMSGWADCAFLRGH